MKLSRLLRKTSFALNKRKHVREYPYVTMIVLHHFFTFFGIDIAKLNEENVKSPKDADIGESIPVFIYNAIYAGDKYLKYIDILEDNIKSLHKANNEWCTWMVDLYYDNVNLNKSELQEVALLSHDDMAKDYIQWELKVQVPMVELIEHIDETINSKTKRNRGKRGKN
jgi:hypothetical protein